MYYVTLGGSKGNFGNLMGILIYIIDVSLSATLGTPLGRFFFQVIEELGYFNCLSLDTAGRDGYYNSKGMNL